jgi:hypothetical protein
MVCNLRIKVAVLRLKYGQDASNIPTVQIGRVFHEKSLEKAPEDWDSNPD